MDALASIGWKVLDRIHIGGLAISPHGIGIAFGYLAGSWWLLREGRARGLREDDMASVLFRALIGAILGARIFYVLGHFSEFNSFVDMLKIYQGGISLIGGIFGAIILAYPVMRKQKMGFLRTMDSGAIGLAFGILFGRVGDLIIGDHLGKPTSWLLSFVYKGGNLSGYDCVTVPGVCRESLSGGQYTIVTSRAAELHASNGALLQSGIGVHQTALYDFISTFFLFALLVWMSRRPRRQGILIATFAIWYGAMRVVTDFLRVDKRFFGMTGSQWASIVVALIALVALLKWAREGRYGAGPGPGDPEPAVVGGPMEASPPPVEPPTSSPVESDHPVTSFRPPPDPTAPG